MNYASYAKFAARITADRAKTAGIATASAATAAYLAYNMVRKARNEAFAQSEAARSDSPWANTPVVHEAVTA